MIQTIANAAVTGSSYVLIAIGLTMVYGQLRLLHVAHAAVYTLGAFVGLSIWRAGGNIWLGLVGAAIIAGLVGVGIYEGVYRHITNRPPLVALIASVGILVLSEALFQQDFFFGAAKQGYRASSGLPRIKTDFIRLPSQEVTLLLVTAVIVVGLLLLFQRSRLGMEWRALALDPDMASAVGIPVHRLIIYNFFLGSALAGIAGVLVGRLDGQVFATMGATPSYKAFVVVVMGGLGNVRGAIFAGFLLALLETVIISQFGYVLPRDAIAFVILIFVLMFRPKGLFARPS